jgi:hypothetical protein
VADGLVLIAIVEAVVVGQLLAGSDVAEGRNPDAAVFLAALAVGLATVVDVHGRAAAFDDGRAVAESKHIGDGRVLADGVGLGAGEAAASVLGHALALADGRGSEAAGAVDGRETDDESHANVRCFPRQCFKNAALRQGTTSVVPKMAVFKMGL